MKLYLLDDSRHRGKLYLAAGVDAVDAATRLIAVIGGDPDAERFSVGGSWNVDELGHIVLSELWPYFTPHPSRLSR